MKSAIRKNSSSVLVTVGVAVGLSGCSALSGLSGFNLDAVTDNVDYKNSGQVNSLEMPPGLSAPDFDSTYALTGSGAISANALGRGEAKAGGGVVLPGNAGIQLMSAGNVRWLQVAAPADAVWPKLQSFWSAMGIGVKRDEPRVGLMETEWAENKAEIPMDFLRKSLGKVLSGVYDAGARDRYKVRLERPAANQTKIFLSHERTEQNVDRDGAVKWVYVPSRPALEGEMLNRLMAFLQGGDPKRRTGAVAHESTQTSVPVAMTQIQGGQPALVVGGTFNQTWIRTGVMLGRIGMSLEGQKRDAGVYMARYSGDDGKHKKKQGIFSRMFRTERQILKEGSLYRIQIADSGNQSTITVVNEDGDLLNANVAQEILGRLKSEFER